MKNKFRANIAVAIIGAVLTVASLPAIGSDMIWGAIGVASGLVVTVSAIAGAMASRKSA